MRLRPLSGTKRVSAMAFSAPSRRVAPWLLGRIDRQRQSFPSLLAQRATGKSNGAMGLSIGTNHCGVQRKITLAFERQLCG
jgi:hypothetical protein